MSIKLKFDGFEDLLNDIQEAGRTMNSAAEATMRQSAQVMHSTLISEMQSAGVDSDLINTIAAPQIEVEGNIITAKVGFNKGSYNPKDPSDSHKVVFLNYGTPHRKKHGKMAEQGFIQKAKKKAMPKIRKQQKATLEKILSRLQK